MGIRSFQSRWYELAHRPASTPDFRRLAGAETVGREEGREESAAARRHRSTADDRPDGVHDEKGLERVGRIGEFAGVFAQG